MANRQQQRGGGRRPDYRVFVSRPGSEEGKSFYTDIGAAWNVGSDGISIKLHPNVAIIGECVLFPPKDDQD